MTLDKLEEYNSILNKLRRDITVPSLEISNILKWVELHKELVNGENLITKITNINNNIIELIDSAKEIFNEIIKSLNKPNYEKKKSEEEKKKKTISSIY